MEKEGPQPHGAVGIGALDNSNFSHAHAHSQTLYMPIASPPTPAPSPGPDSLDIPRFQALNIKGETPTPDASGSNPRNRLREIHSFLSACTPSEILYISQSIAPLLKRDFLRCLPVELGLHILSFIDDPRVLIHAALVSRWWNGLIMGRVNESGWRRICLLWGFLLPEGVGNVNVLCGNEESGASPSQKTENTESDAVVGSNRKEKRRFKGEEEAEEQPEECSENKTDPLSSLERYANLPMDPALEWITSKKRRELKVKGKGKAFPSPTFTSTSTTRRWSYKDHFIYSYKLMTNWRTGGQLLRAHRTPASSSPSADNVITSLALNAEWVIVGLANSRIHVFSGRTGVLARTLVGHESGVWAVCLIAANGREAQSEAEVSDSEDHAPLPPPRNHHSWDNLSSIEGTRNSSTTSNNQGQRGRKQRLFIAPFDEEEEPGRSQEVQYVPPAMRVALGLDLEFGEDDDDISDDDVQSPVESSGTAFASGRNEVHVDTGKPSEPSGCSEGWGQPNAIVVSGGCDKTLRVWDVLSGYCIYVLRGHTSTVRCIKVLHNRPIAISGSRDNSLRVWDVRRGKLLRVLRGHSNSVRCLDVCGNKVVSGSYDCSLKLWNVDTGVCLHTFNGHFSQVYSVAFDGVRIVSGGLDTTVRVWDPLEGQCLALLQGHAALVCQVQLSPYSHLTPTAILVTGGSDGRVITYTLPHPKSFDHSSPFSSISTFTLRHQLFGDDSNSHHSITSPDPEPQYRIQHRLMAHDSSVTALQFDQRWLLTGGNDGRVKLWDVKTGLLVRELGGASSPTNSRVNMDGNSKSSPKSPKRSKSTGRINSSSRIATLEDDGNASSGSGSRSSGVAECVWKAGFSKGGEVCVIMVKHGGKSVMEIWSMRPEEELCSTD